MYVLSPMYMYSCVLAAFHNKRISINQSINQSVQEQSSSNFAHS